MISKLKFHIFKSIRIENKRPKRYQLGELVDYFFRVMRKEKEWGYYRYDMRYDPFFALKVNGFIYKFRLHLN